jgi:type III restriction enzyme
MKVTLRPFQEAAVAEVLSRLESAKLGYRSGAGQRQAVGLIAATGAGKTIIATAVIEAILFGSDEFGTDPDPDAVFLWMTDLPELNTQTQDKMLDAGSDLRLALLPEISSKAIPETLAPGRVYFLNTQKLSAKADLVKKGPLVGRAFTFWDVIRRTIETEGRTLYLVVDEAHRGMTESKKIEEANSIIQRFIKGYSEASMPAVPIVLGISATLERFSDAVKNSGRTTSQWDVPADDVRASGLIKDKTIAEFAGEKQRDAMALFPTAVTTWQTATDDWKTYFETYGSDGDEALVVPALIIQVENEAAGKITATDLDALVRKISEVAGTLPDAAFAHSFGDSRKAVPVNGRSIRYIEPSNIAGDTDARVIFFKTALDTGWDCPRAEVMFSFRKAVDPTSIAQTIGRMVRTPLARRIEENEALNTASVYLPFYDKKGVEAIVARLNESGNDAIARTLVTRRETIVLPKRTDADRAIAAIEAIPTYLVPTPRVKAEVRVLADLANFLAGSGIDPDAYKREMGDCAAVLLARRDALAPSPEFQKEVNDQGDIVILRADLIPGQKAQIVAGVRTVTATEESIGRLFAVAARKLTNEAASAYVRLRLAQDPGSIGTARLEAFALASRDAVMDAVNKHASERIDDLRLKFGAKVDALSPARQTRYRAILRQAPDPSLIPLKLPDTAVLTRSDDALPRHIYADDVGDAPISLNAWERTSIEPEANKEGTLGWLRNGDREGWFCVPWRDGNTWRGFFPDFLVARKHGEAVRVDIIDPHDHTKPDALGKAQGLSAYAAKHADALGHVDLIAKIGTRYRRLHLEKSAIRKQLDDARTLAELKSLYEREG